MNTLERIVEQLRAFDGTSVQGNSSKHFIEIISTNGEVVIGGNREGLMWLALQCADLALHDEPGAHYHLDQSSMADRADLPVVLRVSTAPWGSLGER